MRFEDSQVTTDWLAQNWGEPLWTDSERKQRLIIAYNNEKANAKPPKTATDIPFSYEDIGNDWLTVVLAKGTPGAQVLSFKLGPKDDGTSNRRHITDIEWNDAGKKAGLVTSVFGKATQDLVNRITLSYGAIEAETNFFSSIRPTLDFLEGPVAVHTAMNKETYNSITLLEDLSGQVKFLNCFTSFTKDMLKDQLQTLAKIHGKYYGKDEPEMRQFVHFATGLRGHIASGGVEGANESGWNEIQKEMPAGMHERWPEVWPACLISLDRNHNLPQTLVHCDVHPGNWYQRKDNGKMGLTDFQCFARGPWQRDIAYLLASNLKAEQRREWEKELITFYLEELQKAGGPKVSYEDAFLEIRLQLGSVFIFWSHTLTPSVEMPDMQPYDISYETMTRIIAIMSDWDFLGAAHQFAPQYKVAIPDAPASV